MGLGAGPAGRAHGPGHGRRLDGAAQPGRFADVAPDTGSGPVRGGGMGSRPVRSNRFLERPAPDLRYRRPNPGQVITPLAAGLARQAAGYGTLLSRVFI